MTRETEGRAGIRNKETSSTKVACRTHGAISLGNVNTTILSRTHLQQPTISMSSAGRRAATTTSLEATFSIRRSSAVPPSLLRTRVVGINGLSTRSKSNAATKSKHSTKRVVGSIVDSKTVITIMNSRPIQSSRTLNQITISNNDGKRKINLTSKVASISKVGAGITSRTMMTSSSINLIVQSLELVISTKHKANRPIADTRTKAGTHKTTKDVRLTTGGPQHPKKKKNQQFSQTNHKRRSLCHTPYCTTYLIQRQGRAPTPKARQTSKKCFRLISI